MIKPRPFRRTGPKLVAVTTQMLPKVAESVFRYAATRLPEPISRSRAVHELLESHPLLKIDSDE
jgi:hypothetical protein